MIEQLIVNSQVESKPLRDTPHGRTLELSFQSGKVLRLRFDQGVSYWRCSNRSTRFDFAETSADRAAKDLGRIRFNVEGFLPMFLYPMNEHENFDSDVPAVFYYYLQNSNTPKKGLST